MVHLFSDGGRLVAEKLGRRTHGGMSRLYAFAKRKDVGPSQSQDGSFPERVPFCDLWIGCQTCLHHFVIYSPFRLLLPNLVICSFICFNLNLLNSLGNLKEPTGTTIMDIRKSIASHHYDKVELIRHSRHHVPFCAKSAQKVCYSNPLGHSHHVLFLVCDFVVIRP